MQDMSPVESANLKCEGTGKDYGTVRGAMWASPSTTLPIHPSLAHVLGRPL